MYRKFLHWSLLLLTACVDPLGVQPPQASTRLVVDGLITDLPGPYEVKLFNSNSLSTSKLTPFKPVTQAEVFIVDDSDQYFLLSEAYPGAYRSNANELQGEVGRSYYVFIRTAEGKEYQSSPQTLLASGDITNIYFEFEKDALPGYQLNSLMDGFKIFVDARGLTDQTNLYRWRWTAIHTAKAYPELQVRSTPGGDFPDPPPCSGYIVVGGQLIQVGECTCCICWSYEYSRGAFTSKQQFVNQQLFNKQSLGKIPITAMHFYEKYYIAVQQLSLSEEAYDYWSLIEKQQAGKSDLFQPNAIKIRGNIESLSDPGEDVLGFFSVSGVTSNSIFIDEALVPYALPEIDTVKFSCREYFFNSTTIRPLFW